MRKLRRFLYTWVLCICTGAVVKSQVIIVPEVQAAGVVMKQQMWSVMVNNLSGSARQATLFISVTDLLTSQPLMEATSNILTLPAGAKRLTFTDLSPINYSFAATGFSADRQLNQPLPVGEYMICYRIVDAANKPEVLASECVKVLAEPLSPPQLILPERESVIMDKRPVLSWTPPAPIYMFASISYSVIVSPVLDKQSPEEAIQRNIPTMTTFSSNTSVSYPASFTNLESGKTYAWQVAAMDGNRYGGKSDVWTFTVMPDSVKRIVSSAPYTKLEQQGSGSSIVHQGILKVEYINRYADSAIQLIIYKQGDKRKPYSTELKVTPGQNLLEYNLNGRLKLDEEAIYFMQLINGRKEKWGMRFNVRNYF